jgi:5'-3' exonuclease
MATYLLVDTMNTFFRARHVVRGDISEKVGMAIHITLNAINKCYKQFNADHVVFALEGRSWRKDFYAPYKKNRSDKRASLTPKEVEEDTAFFEAYDDFLKFMIERTNCSAIKCDIAEADDIIARFIAKHPKDEHVIVSSDTDFVQLLTDSVHQYNGITKETIKITGVVGDDGKPVIDKKTGEQKIPAAPDYQLFKKCMRGDSSDNVFSAYPGVREKGSSKKVGLVEAYADKNSKGFAWNNLMLQRWTDHNGVEHRVLDDYERNVMLVDLTAQPAEIRDYVDDIIREHTVAKNKPMVGAHFMKFCGKWDMQRIAENATQFAELLQKNYPEDNNAIRG